MQVIAVVIMITIALAIAVATVARPDGVNFASKGKLSAET